MSEINWQKLKFDMIENGIAPKYVRRTILELSSHYAELKNRALNEGLSELAAGERARKELGDEETLMEEIMSKPELRSLLARYPRLSFLFVPSLALISSFLLVLISLFYMVYSASWLGGLEAGVELPAWRKGVVNLWLTVNCYLVTPLLALATVAAAKERLIKPHWPAIGILLLTVIGCGWAYSLDWPTLSSTGNLDLNWGYSFLPRAIRGDHDIQNYVRIVLTFASAAIFWHMYDPLSQKQAEPLG